MDNATLPYSSIAELGRAYRAGETGPVAAVFSAGSQRPSVRRKSD